MYLKTGKGIKHKFQSALNNSISFCPQKTIQKAFKTFLLTKEKGKAVNE